jgi:hypothetical protein
MAKLEIGCAFEFIAFTNYSMTIFQKKEDFLYYFSGLIIHGRGGGHFAEMQTVADMRGGGVKN